MTGFAERFVDSWPRLRELRDRFPENWLFRGQPKDWPLQTSLERALVAYGISLVDAPEIEEQLIRDFRRRYQGADREVVSRDSLYCFALMQHYGAPTRLLDITYSFFVACLFALDSLYPPGERAVIWCIRTDWTLDATREKVSDIDRRNRDEERNEASFRDIFLERKQAFVFHENPFELNPRLIIQQGGFLCPGDIRKSFEENLKALRGWNLDANVLKIAIDVHADLRQQAMWDLLHMNVSRATLFPGLDGFAGSIPQRLPLLRLMASKKAGKSAT